MDKELAYYVFTYYAKFMNAQERLAYRHLSSSMKATMGGSDLVAQTKARKDEMFSKWLSDDPEVLQLASGGFEQFREQTAERIYREHGGEMFLNCCPKCGKLARTPHARQCRYCGHDWHRDA